MWKWEDPEGGEGISIGLYNDAGDAVAVDAVESGDAEYARVNQLFELARRVVLKSDEVVSEILDELNKPGKIGRAARPDDEMAF